MIHQVYVSIGNSDDKLTQRQWCEFVAEVENVLTGHDVRMHGAWFSRPDAMWQNACWLFDAPANPRRMQDELINLADEYGQDSIAWSNAETTFLGPAPR